MKVERFPPPIHHVYVYQNDYTVHSQMTITLTLEGDAAPSHMWELSVGVRCPVFDRSEPPYICLPLITFSSGVISRRQGYKTGPYRLDEVLEDIKELSPDIPLALSGICNDLVALSLGEIPLWQRLLDTFPHAQDDGWTVGVMRGDEGGKRSITYMKESPSQSELRYSLRLTALDGEGSIVIALFKIYLSVDGEEEYLWESSWNLEGDGSNLTLEIGIAIEQAMRRLDSINRVLLLDLTSMTRKKKKRNR